MGLPNRNGLAIAEIVIYAPLVVLSFALCIRHSFRIFVGWIFLFIFCAIRIVGPALQLARINNPNNIAFYTAPIELFAVGQVVLLYTTIGLLARVANAINQVRHISIKALYIHLLRIPLIAGIILVIIGGIVSASTWISTGKYPVDRLTKIGTIIIVAAFAVIVLVALGFTRRRAEVERPDVVLFNAILLSMPFLLIRLVYSLLIAFVDNAVFNPLNSNAAAQGFLAVLVEAIVVILYTVAGFRIPRLPKPENESSDWSRNRNRFRGGIQRFHKSNGGVGAHNISQPGAVVVDYRKDSAGSTC